MNTLISKLIILFGLFFINSIAYAVSFAIDPDITISEIIPGNPGLLTYEIENDNNANITGIGVCFLPAGVSQITSTSQCGGTVTFNPQTDCGYRFNLNKDQSCILKLCATQAAQGGPDICGSPDMNPPGHRNMPAPADRINITTTTNPAAIDFFDTPLQQPDNVAVIEPGDSFTWTIENVGTATAIQIMPNFSNVPLGTFDSVDYSDCFDTPLEPGDTCEISVTVASDVSPSFAEYPISFQGTNTNTLNGNVLFFQVDILFASSVSFSQPGTQYITLSQTGISTLSGTITLNPNTPALTLVSGGSCGGTLPNFTISTASCTIALQATENALGSYTVTFNYNNPTPQSTTVQAFIADTTVLINNEYDIAIDTGSTTSFPIAIENIGLFTWQNVNFITSNLPAGVSIDTSACASPILPGEGCSATVTPNNPSTPTGTFTATGDNIIDTVANVIVGNVTLAILPPQQQHLQYKGIKISNNFPNPSDDVTLGMATVAGIASSDLQWCSPSTPDCDYVSDCGIGDTIAGGSTCTLWFQSIDNGQTPYDSVLTGNIIVDVIIAPGSIVSQTFSVSKVADLYVGGLFNSVGVTSPVSALDIAKWNSTDTWRAVASSPGSGLLGSGFSDNTLVIYQGDLYAGGSFTSADNAPNTSYIAVWNDNNWSSLPSGGTNFSVQSLIVADDILGNETLYVGGQFSAVGGSINAGNIAQWNGTNWSALGGISNNGANGLVLAMTSFNNGVYMGGEAGHVGPTGSIIQANFIAGWLTNTSTWSALGGAGSNNGANSLVKAMIPSDANTLLVGGNFTAVFDSSDTYPGGLPATGVAAYNSVSNTWSTLGDNSYFNTNIGSVNAFADYAGFFYAGGAFGSNDKGFAAQFNGSTWCTIGTLDSAVEVFYNYANKQLYAGGLFSSNASGPLNSLAILNGTTCVPATDWVQIDGGVSNTSIAVVNSILVASSLTITP